ncbi:hypothetical protein ACFVU3_27785 [Streptomyces sp. NPDC058052]|uniref:hypothetical protein n=1 Tax=Streptomyces sp. NPDC058052 TaxID=3346316 RepID=UPI0036E879F9
MKKRNFAVVGAMAAALVTLSSGTAMAGTNIINVYTTDSTPGGLGSFVANGDLTQVCDAQEDGLSAVAYLRRWDGPLWKTVTVGGYGNCKSESIDIPEGQRLTLTVCLRKNGADVFCSTKGGGVA